MKGPSCRGNARGFTLVELLVTLAVLAILTVLIAQIANEVTTAVRIGNEVSTSNAQARLAFDRLGVDLSNLVMRYDVDFLAGNPSARPPNSPYTLLFLSTVASAGTPSGGNRSVSLIGYQVGPSSDNNNLPCLLRSGKVIGWGDSKFMGLGTNGLPIQFTDPTFNSSFLPNASANPSDWDVLAQGVIRMVVGFQLYPDNNPVSLEDGSTVPVSSNAQGQYVYSPPIRSLTPQGGGTAVNYVDIKRIAAIIVGLVVIDTHNLALLTPTETSTLAGMFTVPAANTLPVASWTPVVNSLVGSLSTAVPLPVLQTVHVYQRAYLINPQKAIYTP
jgi:prepilin-type N-terminal cleavage/methylation domain-containing protein